MRGALGEEEEDCTWAGHEHEESERAPVTFPRSVVTTGIDAHRQLAQLTSKDQQF